MQRVMYVGAKPSKTDNVAGTGLTWTSGQVHEVVDDKAAAKLLQFPTIWVDPAKYKAPDQSPPPGALSGSQHILVVVSESDYLKLAEGSAKLKVIDLLPNTVEQPAQEQAVDVGLAPRIPARPDFTAMTRGQIGRALREVYGIEVDSRKYTDEQMPEVAAQLVGEWEAAKRGQQQAAA